MSVSDNSTTLLPQRPPFAFTATVSDSYVEGSGKCGGLEQKQTALLVCRDIRMRL